MNMRCAAFAIAAAFLAPGLARAQSTPTPAPASAGAPALSPERIADGIWFVSPPAGANVSWIVLPDGVLVIDSGNDAATARAVLAQIAQTAGKPVRYLVVTHAHGDHAGGAAVFAAAGAQVITQENAAAPVASLLGTASGDAPKRPLLMSVSERLALLGGPRRVAIFYLGPAHTSGDLVVLLPEDRILFTGDLVSNKRLPYLRSADANLTGWVQILARLAALDVQRVVPGHGPVGDMQAIKDTGAYIRKVNEIGGRFAAAFVPEETYEEKLREPENTIENVTISPDHLLNVKAAVVFARAHPAAATTPTPGPKAPVKKTLPKKTKA